MSYQNLNVCKSFNQTIDSTLKPLSAQICSEVIIVNRSGADIKVFDSNNFDSSNAFLLEADDSFVFRGLTNSNQLSAQSLSGSGTIYYRTQYFSINPSR
jgi:hypothetical protein